MLKYDAKKINATNGQRTNYTGEDHALRSCSQAIDIGIKCDASVELQSYQGCPSRWAIIWLPIKYADVDSAKHEVLYSCGSTTSIQGENQ